MHVNDMIVHFVNNVWKPRSHIYTVPFLESAISRISKESDDPKFDYVAFVNGEIEYMDSLCERHNHLHILNIQIPTVNVSTAYNG